MINETTDLELKYSPEQTIKKQKVKQRKYRLNKYNGKKIIFVIK